MKPNLLFKVGRMENTVGTTVKLNKLLQNFVDVAQERSEIITHYSYYRLGVHKPTRRKVDTPYDIQT